MRSIAFAGILGLAAALSGCTQTAGRPTGSLDAEGVPRGANRATVLPMSAGLVGQQIGLALGPEDRQAALQAEYRALESGRAGMPISWRGRGSDRFGEVVPGPAYRVNEYDCRDYTHTIVIDGQQEFARGTSCREPDGSWRPVT